MHMEFVMDENYCAMCFMPLKTKEQKEAHIWDLMIYCDEIAEAIRHPGNEDSIINSIHLLKECLSQIKASPL